MTKKLKMPAVDFLYEQSCNYIDSLEDDKDELLTGLDHCIKFIHHCFGDTLPILEFTNSNGKIFFENDYIKTLIQENKERMIDNDDLCND